MKTLPSIRAGFLSLATAAICTGFGISALAQPCPLVLPGSALTSSITQYPNYNSSSPAGVQQQLSSWFIVDVSPSVSGPNPIIPDGLYPAWCVDEQDSINPEYITIPGTTYTGNLYSTCDPNLNSELPPGHPGILVSPAVWQEVNYILNHQVYEGGTNAFWWDVQAAINTLVGSAAGEPNPCGGTYTTPVPVPCPGNAWPVYDPAVVNALVAAAVANAATWVPTCGSVYGALYVTTDPSTEQLDDQVIILEVPVTPQGGSLPCVKSVQAAESAALASITTQLGGTAPTSVSYSVSTSDCPATITVTGSACGTPFSAVFTATILTAPPKFVGTLPPATATYTSYSQVPTAPTLTATDSCGDTASVNYTTSQTNPNSSCDDVITRTWIASDCAGQPTTFTQTITVNNTATQTTTGSCGFQGCKSGYLWCNAHLTCNPGKACTVYCQNATVTLTCKNGKSYSYPVPDCQVNFSQSCHSGNSGYQGNCWQTTVPSCGDSQIFLSGCGIPWQSDFANCTSISWKGDFCCSTPGVNCQWQCGASCYNCNLGNCNQIQVKPCYQNNCGWNNSDCAGTPENCKSYCQGGQSSQGGWGSWGGNSFCGNWSNNGSFSCR